jgi:hypothetical protein
MATWEEVKGHLKSTYNVQKDEGGFVTLVIEYDDDRSQLVLVGARDVKGEEWIQIYSPIGALSANQLTPVLEALDAAEAGGLVKLGDNYHVRHCTPIADLSAEELDMPLRIIAGAADVLEEKFVGGDKN